MPPKKSSSTDEPKRDAAKPRPPVPRDPPARSADLFLGHARAVVIVCACAKTIPANLPRTLEELGVNGIPFQQAVRTAVKAAGCSIGADDIPGAPATRLIQVVTIIQNARRTA